MKAIYTFIRKNLLLLSFLSIVLPIAFYVSYRVNTTRKRGVITAKIIRYKDAESGSDLLIDIYYRDQIYKADVDQAFAPNSFGKFFFIRILPPDPAEYPILYGNRPVPDCIIKRIKYFPGWTNFPTCDSIP